MSSVQGVRSSNRSMRDVTKPLQDGEVHEVVSQSRAELPKTENCFRNMKDARYNVAVPKKLTPISEQLREAIRQSGSSRYKICKSIGLPESTMSQFMSDNCGLAMPTIDRLCKLLGLSLTKTDSEK